MTLSTYADACGLDGLEPVAIIGMACRFPGEASTVSTFWDMIINGRSAHSKIPKDRFNADAFYHPWEGRRGGINTKHGYFLKEDISLFDAPFFQMSAKEAAGMDPMHRLMLEVVYEGLENAGIPMQCLPGSKTSVFHGCFTGDYARLSNADIYNTAPSQATGNGLTMLSNRVSWFFDLRGPSLTVDTACSSSLYALHLACQSLRLRESHTAIVSGSNLILYPDMMHSLTALRFLSPDGVSHSFDERANGYARGEAFGTLVLKPLGAALRDGDTIRAVIRGTGTNQDGRTPGITQPNPLAQADLIVSTYADAGLPLNETDYFEAHGTGTAIGDPTEISALGATLCASRSADQPPLYIASVKTNIGHTEGCSGLAGVLKTVLCLERGLIAPNSGLENLNPSFGSTEWKTSFPKTAITWPTNGLRRASINSFGYGGANAHVIMDDAYHYLKSHGLKGHHSTSHVADISDHDSGFNSAATTAETEQNTSARNLLFVFSAHEQTGLQRMSDNYSKLLKKQLAAAKQLDAHEDPDWKTYKDNLAFTLSEKRSLLRHRSFAVAPSLQRLSEILKGGFSETKRATETERTIWIFTGQGAQWPGMGKELLGNHVFRSSLMRTQTYLESLGCTWSVMDELSDTSNSKVDSPEYSQPLCTALQVALVDLLNHWGLSPAAVVGHSSGEIGAAYAARALSHENSIKVAYQRGIFALEVLRRRKHNTPGAMCAVGLGEQGIEPYLARARKGSVVIACINSPSSVTLSGDVDCVTDIEMILKQDNVFAKRLRVPMAYHSHHMNAVAMDYLQSMAEITTLPRSAEPVVMFSSVTGDAIDHGALDASYWVSNLVSPVRFLQACTALLNYSPPTKDEESGHKNYNAMIEIGPHEVLRGPMNQIMSAVDAKLVPAIPYTSLLFRGENAEATALLAAGNLWCQGLPIQPLKVNQIEVSKSKILTNLPSYPWNHTKGFWHEPASSKQKRFQEYARTDFLGAPIDHQIYHEPRWRNFLSTSENPWLEHHMIQSSVLFPGAGMLVMAIEAAMQMADSKKKVKGLQLRDVNFERGLVIPLAPDGVEIALNMHPHNNGNAESGHRFTVYSCPTDGTWTEHSTGLIDIIYENEPGEIDGLKELTAEWEALTMTYEGIRKNSSVKVDHRAFYEDLRAIGMQYGPLFTNLVDAYAAPGTRSGHGCIVIPDTESVMPHRFEFPHLIHPATLDAIFHLLFICFAEGGPLLEAIVPVRMESMYISADLPKGAGKKFYGFSVTTLPGERESAGRLVCSDEDWKEPKIVIENFAAREVSSGATAANVATGMHSRKICGQLQWKEDINSFKGEAALAVMKNEGGNDVWSQLRIWLDRLCHKEADLNVLLVDGTSFNILEHVLQQFGPGKGKRFCFKQCTVAKETEYEVAQAEANQSEHGPVITYKKLDFSTSVEEQGFVKQSFDLVMADLKSRPDAKNESRMMIFRSLLRNSRKLILTGSKTPNVDEAQFKSSFESAGFGNVDTYLEINAGPESSNTAIAITSITATTNHMAKLHEIVILQGFDPSSDALHLERNLSMQLIASGYSVRTAAISDKNIVKGSTIISLIEVEKPWVINWTAEDLRDFHDMVNAAVYVLWLTRGGQMIDSEAIDFAPSTGLLRTIRTEIPQITLPHLDLSPHIGLTAIRTTELILQTFQSTISQDSTMLDMEFVEKNGCLLIPRLAEDTSFDRELAGCPVSAVPSPGWLHQFERPLKIAIRIPGLLGSLYWTADEVAGSDIAPEDVEIKTSSIGLNMVDLEAAMGHPLITTVGCEVAGIVSRIGSEVSRFFVGQQVVVLKDAASRTIVRQHQGYVHAVPDNMSLPEAAASVLVCITAYHALYELAHIMKGETILIHSAAGGLGQTAIQLAKHLGAEVYVTVGSIAKKELLMGHYGIPEDHIFNSRDTTFAKGLMRMTGGAGVDVAISACTGEAMRLTWLCMADFGRFINISRRMDKFEIAGGPLKRNVVFHSINIAHFLKAKKERVSKLLQKSFNLIRSGVLRCPYPLITYMASDIEKALKLMQSGNHYGKIVIDIQADQIVPVATRGPQPLRLDPEAAYLLSGGLGGLGSSLAETMFQAGARRLIFISRSGTSSLSSTQLLESFRQRGCEVDGFACDVSDYGAVAAVVKECEERKWRIKGVVQCAMVLRDSTFENMTFEKWTQATRPKIQGSWNLHKALPRDMDFFIMLSSVVGIVGNAAQANYIAGNTYMDALAHLRRSHGLVATSLDVGVVSDSGHFTDDAAFEHFLQRFPHLTPLQITTRDLNVVLTTLMKGKTTDDVPVPAQLIMGINDQLRREGNITSAWAHDRKFNHRIAPDIEEHVKSGEDTISEKLRGAKTLSEAGAAVEAAVKVNFAASISADPEDINGEVPLQSYGLDSLKAVEVRNWVFRELKAEVSVFDILSKMSLTKLSRKIARNSSYVSAEVSGLSGDAEEDRED